MSLRLPMGVVATILVLTLGAAGCGGKRSVSVSPTGAPVTGAAGGAPGTLPRSEAVPQLTGTLSEQLGGHSFRKLAVLDFLDLSGRCSELGRLIAEDLTTALFKPGAYEVIERSRLRQIFEDIGESQSPTPETMRLLTEELGVDAAVVGSVAEVGQNYRVNGRVVSTENMSLLATAGIELRGSSEVRVLFSRSCETEVARTAGTETGSAVAAGPEEEFVPGLLGEYYNDPDALKTPDGAANPAVVRVDPSVDFDWTKKSPAGRIQGGRYAVRWTGEIRAPRSGTYTFRVQSRADHRVTIDGKTIIERGGTPVDVSLQEGWHEVSVVFRKVDSQGGRVQVLWAIPGAADLTPIATAYLRCRVRKD